MARCSECSRSGLFLRTNAHGFCTHCWERALKQNLAVRETIKRDLISARIVKDQEQRLRHLQSALDSTRTLVRHERRGCPQPKPSPKALQAFLEERLREARAAQRRSAGGEWSAGDAIGEAGDELTPAGSARLTPGRRKDLRRRSPQTGAGEEGAVPGTRRVRRHPAMFGVWMDRSTAALTEDISPLGLCVRSEALLKPGTRVGVTLEGPDGEVTGEGMVRWAHPADTDEDSPIRAVMGVEFLVPPPELQRYG